MARSAARNGAKDQVLIPDDALLGAVTLQVEEHRSLLAAHGAALADHGAAIEVTQGAVSDLQDDFAKLAKALDAVPKVVCWVNLDDQGAADAWAGLLEWVSRVLVPRYSYLTQPGHDRLLPPCWYQHPALVEELSALHMAWLYTFEDPNAPLTASKDWHRALAETRGRIGGIVKCTSEHSDDRPAGPPVDDGFDAFVAADISSRPVRPVPDDPAS